MKYFLDTNICIYFLKGMYPKILEKMMAVTYQEIKIASMVKAELLLGVEKSQKKKENMDKVEKFLIPFEIISFDSHAALVYSKTRAKLERKGEVIGPNDLIICATVMANKGILITNNCKEFSKIEGLLADNWIK